MVTYNAVLCLFLSLWLRYDCAVATLWLHCGCTVALWLCCGRAFFSFPLWDSRESPLFPIRLLSILVTWSLLEPLGFPRAVAVPGCTTALWLRHVCAVAALWLFNQNIILTTIVPQPPKDILTKRVNYPHAGVIT